MPIITHSTTSAFVAHTTTSAYVTRVVAATNLALSGLNVLDSDVVGTVVGTASATFGIGAASIAWSLVVSAGGKYAIDPTTGVVTVADVLTAGTNSITVQVTQGGKAPATATFSINVALETIASNIVFNPAPVSNIAAIGAAVGTASTTDNQTYVWSLTVNPGGRWAINSATGLVTVASGLTAGTDSITIRIAFGTKSYAHAFSIVISVPTITSISLPGTQMNTSYTPGEIIGVATASGAALGGVTYSIPGGQDSGGLVTIDTNGTLRAGSITLVTGTYPIQITGSPVGGSPFTSSFTITVVPGGNIVTLDATTLTAYQSAIGGATAGAKRVAGAQAVANAIGTSPTLTLFQNGVAQATVMFGSALQLNYDGTDIWLSLQQLTVSTTTTADIFAGVWTFTISNGSASITGTAGPNSSYMMDMSVTNLYTDTTGLDCSLRIVIPQAIDSGATSPTLTWLASFDSTKAVPSYNFDGVNGALYYFSGGIPGGITLTIGGSAATASNLTVINGPYGSGSSATGIIHFRFTSPAPGSYAFVATSTGTYAAVAPTVTLAVTSQG